MTPEEWGKLVVAQYENRTGTPIDIDILVANAIREAVEVERRRIARGLAKYYDDNSMLIATMCDEELDRSGAMLGWVRNAAIKARATNERKEDGG